jgi:hypothetical protein
MVGTFDPSETSTNGPDQFRVRSMVMERMRDIVPSQLNIGRKDQWKRGSD